jgi:hypothetical protein
MTFAPTHQCFDDALDLLERIVKENRHDLDDWRLVHAVCKAEGGLFAHAWCERNRNEVVTAFIIEGKHTYVTIPRRDFYRLFEPQMMTKYTVPEAWMHNRRTNHYGPWLDCYKIHCSNGRQIMGAVEVAIRE